MVTLGLATPEIFAVLRSPSFLCLHQSHRVSWWSEHYSSRHWAERQVSMVPEYFGHDWTLGVVGEGKVWSMEYSGLTQPLYPEVSPHPSIGCQASCHGFDCAHSGGAPYPLLGNHLSTPHGC